MANVIHGEVKLNSKNVGQMCDLIAILVTNGYKVEVKQTKDFTPQLVVVIMTEVDK